MKKFTLLLIALFIFLISSTAVFSAPKKLVLKINNKTAFKDSTKIILDSPPIIVNGNTLVPVSFIAKAFNSSINWSSKKKSLYIESGKTNIELNINNKNARINGSPVKLSTPAKIIKGRVMVPVSFISKAFGCDVTYNNTSKHISITLPNNPPTAKFSYTQLSPYIGGEVIYQNESFDIDGDSIVSSIWVNNSSSFDTSGTHTVKLKVKDSHGKWSDWAEKTFQVLEPPGAVPVANFSFANTEVIIGDKIEYIDQSYSPENETIVERIWDGKQDAFDKPGSYKIGLRVRDIKSRTSEWFYQTLEVKDKPNNPPVAKFSVDSLIYNQGETVTYTIDCSDPDGDNITSYKWANKKRAYFEGGTQTITLQVLDSRGLWSEPYSQEITVTNFVKMSEIDYNLKNPLPGEIVNIPNLKPKTIFCDSKCYAESDSVLLLSDSPETVFEDGVLYKDTVIGDARLMYYHKNGTSSSKRIFLLAKNTTSDNVTIKIPKYGYGGPSEIEIAVGKNSLIRYLSCKNAMEYHLKPGETIILDGNQAGKVLLKDQVVCAMMDVNVDGAVEFGFVFLSNGKDAIAAYPSLPLLETNMHQRGTFKGADRYYTININGLDSQRIFLVDNSNDPKAIGKDALNGEEAINKGNYGIVYHMNVIAENNVGIFTSPRGGAFSGASILPDGTVYGTPESGLVTSLNQGVMNGIANAGTEYEYVFIPPPASNLPVSIIFIPFE